LVVLQLSFFCYNYIYVIFTLSTVRSAVLILRFFPQ
jgi:hypothetical protein